MRVVDNLILLGCAVIISTTLDRASGSTVEVDQGFWVGDFGTLHDMYVINEVR